MRLRFIISIVIAVIPFWGLRQLLYRLLLGYEFDSQSRISAFTILHAREVRMSGAMIGPLNFLKLDTLVMQPGSRFGKLNRVSSVRRISLGPDARIVNSNFIGGTFGTPLETGREMLELGARSQLTIMVFVDLYESITFGEDVVAGGARSQFWTHGFDCYRNRISGPIRIGDRVFIGASSIVLPKVDVCSEVTIGAGTVLHRSITESGLYVSSQLQRKA